MTKPAFSRAFRSSVLCGGVALLALVAPQVAAAQTAPVQDSEQEALPETPSSNDSDVKSDDLVVTGTLIRGIAPAGSNVIGVSQAQIESTTATTTNQVLATLPQVQNFFNAVPAVGGNVASANAVVPIQRPNLRGLPGVNTSGGALTLVLIDGHRVVGAGIGQVAVDPDVVPPGALERVEAITDGGSAVYGSDAIGGVINFITRRRFDGIQANARVGFADNYKTYDGNVTVGKDWGTGSLYLAYNYAQHDALFGADLDYITQRDWVTGVPTGRQCDVPNITTVNGTRSFALPGLVLGTFNSCDLTDLQTYVPSDRQHHVFSGFSQQLNDAIRVEIKAYYTDRKDVGNTGPFRSTVTISPTNPNYRNLTGTDANLPQAVSFSYGPVFGDRAGLARTYLSTWNVTPSVSADLFGDWQLRTLFNYGESKSKFDNDALFASRVTAAAASTNPATALNPYNIVATPAPVLDSFRARNVGESWHQFTNFRAIMDGTLFHLPGGDVHVAVGAEYFKTRYEQQLTNTTTFTKKPAGGLHPNRQVALWRDSAAHLRTGQWFRRNESAQRFGVGAL